MMRSIESELYRFAKAWTVDYAYDASNRLTREGFPTAPPKV